jgi:hypothetical protein
MTRRYGPADRTPHRVGTAVYDKQTADLLHDAIQDTFVIAPYYWVGVQSLTYRPEPGLGTMATSAHWVTYYDPAMLRQWTTRETAAVIVHELEHLLRRHAERAPENCNHQRFNIAGDMEINQRLTGLPDGAMYPERYNMPHGLTAETMYRLMPDDDETQGPPNGDGDGDGDGESGDESSGEPSKCGSAAGGPAGAYEVPGKGITEAQAESIIRQVASIAAGTADSAEVRAWAESELGIDKSAWMSALASAISGSIAAVSAPDGWVWPMRRDITDMGGAMMPRWTGHQPKCAVVIDTSGSITDNDISMAVAAGQFIAQAAEVTFYGCNTKATLYGASLPDGLRGGGGTDLRVGIDAAIADGAALVVVITDTYTPWHDEAPSADIIIGGGMGAPVNGQSVPDYATYLPIAGDLS